MAIQNRGGGEQLSLNERFVVELLQSSADLRALSNTRDITEFGAAQALGTLSVAQYDDTAAGHLRIPGMVVYSQETGAANSVRLAGDAEAGRLGEIYRRQYHERRRHLLNMLGGSAVTAIRQPDGPVFREEREEGVLQLTKIFTAIQGYPVDIDPLNGVMRLRWADQLFEVGLLDRDGVLAVSLIIG